MTIQNNMTPSDWEVDLGRLVVEFASHYYLEAEENSPKEETDECLKRIKKFVNTLLKERDEEILKIIDDLIFHGNASGSDGSDIIALQNIRAQIIKHL